MGSGANGVDNLFCRSCFTSTLSPGLMSDSLAFLFLSAYTFAFAFTPLSLSFSPKQQFGWAHPCSGMQGRPICTCTLHPSNLSLPLVQSSSFSTKIYFVARPPHSLGAIKGWSSGVLHHDLPGITQTHLNGTVVHYR